MPEYRFEEIAFNLNEKKIPTPDDKYSYIGLEHLDSGKLEVTRWGSEVDITGQKLVMRKGDILFGRRNTYLRRIAIAPHDGLFSAHGMIFRPNTKVINEKLFPFFLASDYFMDAAIRISVGSLSPTVNWGTLKEIAFRLPKLELQKELAEQLYAANETKVAYEQLLTQTDKLVKSRFVEMFGMLGSDEKRWGLKQLRDCCEINPKKSQNNKLVSGLKVSFLPMTAVSEAGELDLTEERDYDDVKTGFTYFIENDVLFAKITPCMENGKGAIAKGLLNGIGFGSTEFHVLRPIKDISNPQWLYVMTTFELFRQDAALNMTGSAGQRRVPSAYLEAFQIALPPISVQNEFATFFNNTAKSKSELMQAIIRTNNLMKSLMQQDFQ